METTLRGKTVLVCDSDESIVSMLTDIFRDEGSRVTSALGGQASLDALKTGRFDLVVQGLVMPDVDGWDVLAYVRSRRPDLLRRMILMTGYTYDPYTVRRLHALQMPALFKPFDLEDLRKTALDTLYVAETETSRTAA